MDAEIAQNTALYAQDTAQLTRSQRLAFRNEVILAKIATGITVEEIQKEFQLGRRQVYSIIKDAENQVEEWFVKFPKSGMLSLFRSNIISVSDEIKELTGLKVHAQSLDEKLDVSKSIIDARIKFNKLVAEGTNISKTKAIGERV